MLVVRGINEEALVVLASGAARDTGDVLIITGLPRRQTRRTAARSRGCMWRGEPVTSNTLLRTSEGARN